MIIKFSDYKLITEDKINKEYNGILKQLGVVDENGELILANLNKKISDFLSNDANKNAFLKEIKDIDIKGEKVKIKAKKLQAGQKAIYLDQVLNTIFSKPNFVSRVIEKNIANKNDFLISSDNYIIDGHHRWCAAFILNPRCKIKCTQINLPFEVAVPIIHAILDKELNSQKDQEQSGKEKMNVFKLAYDINLPEILNKLIQKKEHTEVTELFDKIKEIDKKDSPIQYLVKNIKKLPKYHNDIKRKDMPQLTQDIDEIID